MIQVSGLFIYPIKSCGGTGVERATLDAKGFVDDRRFMIVDDAGCFLTQRELPRLALIAPRTDADTLSLTAPGMTPVSISIVRGPGNQTVTVWDDTCSAIDQGDAASAWLSAFLDTRCRLVRLADDTVRRIDPTYATSPEDEVSFADAYPLLLIGEASLADLNGRLDTPLPMNRFRPNVVVSGSAPYAEDTWRSIEIGDVRAQVVKPCVRCVTTTVDQATGDRGKEPLRTLATYRKGPRGVMFGQNVIHTTAGTINVGDDLRVIDR
jgi:uncharacterized protein YcbX